MLLYRDDDGSVPILDWLDSLAAKEVAKCRVRIERLAALGHELRRPEADLLQDGIYELRVGLGRRNYRLLYFFHGQAVAVLSHGLVKERVVLAKQIDRAVQRRHKFMADPKKHTYEAP